MELKAIRPFQFLTLGLSGIFVLAVSVGITGQTPSNGPGVRFTATTASVSGAGQTIKINLTNWSTDAQRDAFAAAWTLTAPAAAPAAAGRGGRGARGGAAARGGGRGGRGGAAVPDASADVPPDPDAVDADNPAFRFGRGGARGGRGGADDAAPATPEGSLAAALKKAATVGILWTSETVGYSIKYAYRLQQPDGGERIVLATDRRVGAWSDLWKPAAGSAATPDYAFSIIELRMNSKGEGDGKGAISGKVTIDSQDKTIALDGYSTLPVIFKGVKRQ
jgi:hypothetical protein